MKKKIYVCLGTFLMAFAIKSIFEPANLVTGGFSGVAIIIKNIFNVPLWISTLFLNVPLFLIAGILIGRNFVSKSLFGAVLFTTLISFIPDIGIWNGDMFLAAIFGGIINGVGVGMILMSGATTGGSDMLASIVHKYKRHLSVPSILQLIDGAIIICGAFVTGLSHAMYALVVVYVTGFMSDAIIDGLKFAKAVYIISDKYEEIANSIMKELSRGVTALEAMGMYTNESKKVLFSVMSKKEMAKIRDKVMEIDGKAFFVVYDIKEVLGEGFVQK